MRNLQTAALAAGTALVGAAAGEYFELEREQVRAELQTGLPSGALDAAFLQVREVAQATGERPRDIAPLVTVGTSRGLAGEELEQFIAGGAIQQLLYQVPAAQIGEATLGLSQQYGLGFLETADIIGGAVQANPRLASELVPFLQRPGAAGREIGLSLEDTLAAAVVQVQNAENPSIAFTQLRSLLTELATQAGTPGSFLQEQGLNTGLLRTVAEDRGIGGIISSLEARGFDPITDLGREEAALGYIALRDNPEALARAQAGIGGTYNVLYDALQRFGDDPATLALRLRNVPGNVIAESITDIARIAQGDLGGLRDLAIPSDDLERGLRERVFARGDPSDVFGGRSAVFGVEGLVRTPEVLPEIAQQGFLANLGLAVADAFSVVLGGGRPGGAGLAVPGVVVNVNVSPDATTPQLRQQIEDEIADTGVDLTSDRYVTQFGRP